MKVRISDIKVNGRKRPANAHKVKELAESINHLGLLNPITISKEKELIAGVHRLEAHKLLGLKTIDASIKDFQGIKKTIAEIDENLIRHELSDLECGELMLERDELLQELGIRAKSGDNRFTKNRGEQLDTPIRTKEIASKVGISERTSQKRKQIAKNLSTTAKEKLRDTDVASNTSALLSISKLPTKYQDKVASRIADNSSTKSAKKAIADVYREDRQRKIIKEGKNFKLDDSVKLLCGDFRKLCDDIEDNSISLILIDPPYSKEFIPHLEDLGEIAKRILTPSGFLISYIGCMYIPEAIAALNKNLTYHWMSMVKHGRRSNRIFHHKVWNMVRPVLHYYKPPMKRKHAFFQDFYETDEVDKELHYYQQSMAPLRYIISKFTRPNEIVLDTFSGTGSTVIAALSEKRRAIGIEKENKLVKTAKGRVKQFIEKG